MEQPLLIPLLKKDLPKSQLKKAEYMQRGHVQKHESEEKGNCCCCCCLAYNFVPLLILCNSS